MQREVAIAVRVEQMEGRDDAHVVLAAHERRESSHEGGETERLAILLLAPFSCCHDAVAVPAISGTVRGKCGKERVRQRVRAHVDAPSR